MANLQFGKGAFKRTYGKEPDIVLLNRFFEQNPSNRVDAVALLSRPGDTFLAGAGVGPIRANYFQDGTINGNLFTVSGKELYMFEKDLTRTHILGTVAGVSPVMAGTATALWITDGVLLQFFDGVGSRAQGVLTVLANPTPGDTVTLGSQTYTFVGVPPTVADQVLIGSAINDSVQNLTDAINRDLGEGTRYGANTQVNVSAVAVNNEDGTMTAIAKMGGSAGNVVSTTAALGSVRATGTLTFTPGTITTQTVQIGGVYYIFTATPTSNPFAAGTVGQPWQVFAGATAAAGLLNLQAAINGSGTPGTTYSTALTAHPTVDATAATATTVSVRAKAGGTAGNAISTTVPSGAGLAWGGTTLSGGVAGATGWAATTLLGGVNDSLSGVATPDDVGIVSLCVLNGFVFLAAANSDRIYWILPGEITIDPLNFVTAETQPDGVISLMTVGDQFWAFGSQTTQPFYLTGNEDAPVAPVQGRAFSQGVVEGTACLLNQQVVVVGSDDIVYLVGGGPKPISDQSISERIRKALVAERDAP